MVEKEKAFEVFELSVTILSVTIQKRFYQSWVPTYTAPCFDCNYC